jgi:DNA-directed RNA polymerase specialized sigma24 family protein
LSSYAQIAIGHVGRLVVDFLAGDERAREALPRDLGKKLHQIAGEVAPDLRMCGLTEDVVQHMYLLLLTRPADHYDPDRAGPWPYLRTMLWLAARDVRAKDAPAGTLRRPRRPQEAELPEAHPLIFHQDSRVPDETAEYFEDLVLSEIAAAAFIEAVPATAPAWLARALSLFAEGLTVTETADALGLSRFTLRRALDRWIVPRAGGLR